MSTKKTKDVTQLENNKNLFNQSSEMSNELFVNENEHDKNLYIICGKNSLRLFFLYGLIMSKSGFIALNNNFSESDIDTHTKNDTYFPIFNKNIFPHYGEKELIIELDKKTILEDFKIEGKQGDGNEIFFLYSGCIPVTYIHKIHFPNQMIFDDIIKGSMSKDESPIPLNLYDINNLNNDLFNKSFQVLNFNENQNTITNDFNLNHVKKFQSILGSIQYLLVKNTIHKEQYNQEYIEVLSTKYNNYFQILNEKSIYFYILEYFTSNKNDINKDSFLEYLLQHNILNRYEFDFIKKNKNNIENNRQPIAQNLYNEYQIRKNYEIDAIVLLYKFIGTYSINKTSQEIFNHLSSKGFKNIDYHVLYIIGLYLGYSNMLAPNDRCFEGADRIQIDTLKKKFEGRSFNSPKITHCENIEKKLFADIRRYVEKGILPDNFENINESLIEKEEFAEDNQHYTINSFIWHGKVYKGIKIQTIDDYLRSFFTNIFPNGINYQTNPICHAVISNLLNIQNVTINTDTLDIESLKKLYNYKSFLSEAYTLDQLLPKRYSGM